jgi:hypothetical protein
MRFDAPKMIIAREKYQNDCLAHFEVLLYKLESQNNNLLRTKVN